MSQPCPPRPDSRTPAASLMRGWKTCLHTFTLSLPSIYKFSLFTCWQSQSSWSVICNLPVWGCHKVSMQLKVHFLLPTQQITAPRHWIDTHIYSHTHKYCLCHTCQMLHKWQREITNHVGEEKAITNRFHLCQPERASNIFILSRKYLPRLRSLPCVIASYYVLWSENKNQSGQIHHRWPLFCQFAEGKRIYCMRQIIKPGLAAMLILQSGQRRKATWRNGSTLTGKCDTVIWELQPVLFLSSLVFQPRCRNQKWDTYMWYMFVLFQRFSQFFFDAHWW